MKLIFTATLFFISLVAASQDQFLGKIVNERNKEPLSEVLVEIENTSLSTKTNHLGYFQLDIDSGKYIKFSKQGYLSATIEIPKERKFLLSLKPAKLDTPEYIYGNDEFYKYLGLNLKYPIEARREGIEGCTYCSFSIDTDGEMTDIKVLNSLGGGIEDEVRSVLMSTPSKWIPSDTSVNFIIPITFRLGRNSKEGANGGVELPHQNVLAELVVTAIGIDSPPKSGDEYEKLDIPRYMGGSTFYNLIAQSIRYPKKARKEHIEGRIYYSFTISTDGELKMVRRLNDIGGNLGKEVKSALYNLPSRWRPAHNDYEFILPIRFDLTGAIQKDIGEDFDLPHNNFLKEIVVRPRNSKMSLKNY